MDEGRRVLRSLHEVGVEGIAQQHGDGTCHAQVADTEWLSVSRDAQQDVLDTPLQVFLTRGETEDGHQFRGWGDVEPRLLYHAVAPHASHDVAQSAVVDVEHALPVHLA